MNVRQLAELAGLLSVHAIQIVESPALGPAESFFHLQDVSRRRSEAWHERMRLLGTGSDVWSALYADDPKRPLIEEILVSEILSRMTAGLLTAWGQQHGERVVSQFARELFAEHQQARRMALAAMIEMADAENPAVRPLDRLRKRAERWSDLLLGALACRWNLQFLLFDPCAAKEAGQMLLACLPSPSGSGLLSAGLQVAFPESIAGVPSHSGFHREVAASVLGLLPGDLFEKDGGLLPLREVRFLRSIPSPDARPGSSAQAGKPARPVSPHRQTPWNPFFSELRRRQEGR